MVFCTEGSLYNPLVTDDDDASIKGYEIDMTKLVLEELEIYDYYFE
jgi:hypothetical protein